MCHSDRSVSEWNQFWICLPLVLEYTHTHTHTHTHFVLIFLFLVLRPLLPLSPSCGLWYLCAVVQWFHSVLRGDVNWLKVSTPRWECTWPHVALKSNTSQKPLHGINTLSFCLQAVYNYKRSRNRKERWVSATEGFLCPSFLFGMWPVHTAHTHTEHTRHVGTKNSILYFMILWSGELTGTSSVLASLFGLNCSWNPSGVQIVVFCVCVHIYFGLFTFILLGSGTKEHHAKILIILYVLFNLILFSLFYLSVSGKQVVGNLYLCHMCVLEFDCCPWIWLSFFW